MSFPSPPLTSSGCSRHRQVTLVGTAFRLSPGITGARITRRLGARRDLGDRTIVDRTPEAVDVEHPDRVMLDTAPPEPGDAGRGGSSLHGTLRMIDTARPANHLAEPVVQALPLRPPVGAPRAVDAA